jgi:CheY-like chemotaxis protein
VIAATGNVGAGDAERYLAAGFDCVLRKSFDARGLAAAIAEAMRHRRSAAAQEGVV